MSNLCIPRECPKQSVTAVNEINTIIAENEKTKGAIQSAASRFELNQIDFKGHHTTSPSNALSGLSELTLSVFRIISNIVNAPNKRQVLAGYTGSEAKPASEYGSG